MEIDNEERIEWVAPIEGLRYVRQLWSWAPRRDRRPQPANGARVIAYAVPIKPRCHRRIFVLERGDPGGPGRVCRVYAEGSVPSEAVVPASIAPNQPATPAPNRP